jgi:NADPH:quinone reductase-like Zn-dependent oxidoreductase
MVNALSGLAILAVVTTFLSAAAAQEPTTAPTMSAIRTSEVDGKPVPQLQTVPRPSPGNGELLLRVYAAGVNPVDWKVPRGGSFTPGFDVSGVVTQVGEGVTTFKAGDAIFAYLALNRGGGFAEYAIVKESEAAFKPAKASHVAAAAVPLAALTAWQALFDTAKLQPGQTVLIHAGAGGVGSFAVQLAKWKGAHVIATASKENQEFLKQIGADETIDYKNQKFEDVAKDVDVVLDPIGGQTQEDSWKLMKKGGILVSLVGRPSAERAKQLDVRATGILVHPSGEQLAEIAKLMDNEQIRPIVSYAFPLADTAKAYEQSQTGHTRGKIVLKVRNE